ncbi:MAG: TIR domain-containing protein, partial [Bacilli bacterium]|nr:TIR domain-containing protein [Bacilli bacterium]
YKILKPKIDWVGTVVVLIGKETKNRPYVNWEIEYAIRHEKKIIGVYLPGATEEDVPEGVLKYGDSLVTWEARKITKALSGGTEWETPKGTRRPDVETRGVCK